MYMKTMLTLLLFVICENCISQITSLQESKLVRNKYQETLERVIKILEAGKSPKVSLIEFCIPETDQEATLFFDKNIKKENWDAFNVFYQKISELILTGDGRILEKYLIFSQFVDGVIAETYFDNIEKVIQRQQKLFCKIIDGIPKEKTKRLADFRTQAGCNQKE
jgi:hypothetical protein